MNGVLVGQFTFSVRQPYARLFLDVEILNVLVNNYESYTSVVLQFIVTQSVTKTLPKIQSSNSKNVIKKV